MSETAYITTEEADALIAAALLSTDTRRTRWEALDADDKAALLTRATEDIDAVAWLGTPQLPGEQTLQWPRLVHPRRCTLIDPTADADASVAGVPERVRRACAVQAAHHALRSAGLDPTRRTEEAARRGVLSMNAGGHSETVDLKTANHPWSRLCLDAQRLLARYRAASVEVV